jgi:hypothetical protein
MRMCPSSAIVQFRTDKRVRFTETASACLELTVGVPGAILLAFLLGLILYVSRLPLWLCAGLGLGGGIAFVLWAVNGAVSRLRFSVILYDGHLQLGGGFMLLRIPYDEVEMFGFTKKTRPDCIGLLWRGRNLLIRLPKSSLDQCLRMLRAACANAIYIDPAGHTYLPENPDRPDFTVATLWRHYRRTARTALAAFIVCSLLAIYFAAALLAGLFGRVPLEVVFADLAVSLAVVAIASWAMYRKYSKRARVIAD